MLQHKLFVSALLEKERRVLLAHVASRHRGAFLVHTEHGVECSLFDGSVGLHHNTGKGKLNQRAPPKGKNVRHWCEYTFSLLRCAATVLEEGGGVHASSQLKCSADTNGG